MTRFFSRSHASRLHSIALVEVEADSTDIGDILFYLDWVLREQVVDVRLAQVPVAPFGKARFQILIDGFRGARATALRARTLLDTVQSIALGDGLPGYRLVEGANWLSEDPIGSRDALQRKTAASRPQYGDRRAFP